MIPRPPIMPVLTGTPKQVAWAETVCAKRIPEVLDLAGNECERAYAETLILQAIHANWWIDRRSQETSSLVRYLLDDFGTLVSRPNDGAPAPDMDASVVRATDVGYAIEKTRANIESEPGYNYFMTALTERITAGLAPGDGFGRGARKSLYLGHRRIMIARVGHFGVVLGFDVLDATDEQLDGMLMVLGRRAAMAAVHPSRDAPQRSPSVRRQPKLPTTVMRRALMLADSVTVGETVAADADSVVEAIEWFEGGIVVELGQPFFGRRDEARDLLVQFAYIRPLEAG